MTDCPLAAGGASATNKGAQKRRLSLLFLALLVFSTADFVLLMSLVYLRFGRVTCTDLCYVIAMCIKKNTLEKHSYP